MSAPTSPRSARGQPRSRAASWSTAPRCGPATRIRRTYMILFCRTGAAREDRHGGAEPVPGRSANTPGITIRPIYALTGEHHFNEVVFQDVFVAGNQLLGQDGRRLEAGDQRTGLRAQRAGAVPVFASGCSIELLRALGPATRPRQRRRDRPVASRILDAAATVAFGRGHAAGGREPRPAGGAGQRSGHPAGAGNPRGRAQLCRRRAGPRVQPRRLPPCSRTPCCTRRRFRCAAARARSCAGSSLAVSACGSPAAPPASIVRRVVPGIAYGLFQCSQAL